MKKMKFLLVAICFTFTAFTIGCKGKTAESTKVDNTTSTTATTPVVSADDELKKNVVDATKDYPEVKTDVSDGVITLTGSINRSDWQKLNPTLNTLHPKRINSTNLTIK